MFTEEDLKLFEFQADLKYYYNDGAAYNITAEMTQPLFEDLFTKIDEIQSNKEANISILNFAHSETLQPFMTALGLYRDEEDLLASDWDTSKQEHKWQVSKIASFATNIGIVVFECEENRSRSKSAGKGFRESEEEEDELQSSEENNSSEEENIISPSSEWKIMVFHQEKAVLQPACGQEICTLSEFSEAYRHLAEQDFDTICNNTQ